MSSNLYWRPKNTGQKLLSDELKHALKNVDPYGQRVNREFGEEDIDLLRGMLAAGIEDAGKLIEAIEKHGAIEVSEEY